MPSLIRCSIAMCLFAAAAHAQVALVDFRWTSMGGSAASVSGACNMGCVPQSICMSDPADSYTLSGSTMAPLSISGNASRTCGFACVNNGSSGNAGSTAGIIINVHQPENSPDFTRWGFSHHAAGSAGTTCHSLGCVACFLAGADASTDHEWHLIFDLLSPALVTLDHSSLLQRANIIGSSTATWNFAGPTGNLFSLMLDTNTNPTTQSMGSRDFFLPSGRYTLDLYASTDCSPSSGDGQSQDAVTVNKAAGTLAIRTYSCPTILSQPADVIACPSSSATFAVTHTGTAPITLQWQHQLSTGGPWIVLAEGTTAGLGTISGATTPSLTLSSFGPDSPGAYRCVLTNLCGDVMSNSASLAFGDVCDVNADGGSDITDVLDLADAIASGNPVPNPSACADFNQDGAADLSDVLDLSNSIAAGTCP